MVRFFIVLAMSCITLVLTAQSQSMNLYAFVEPFVKTGQVLLESDDLEESIHLKPSDKLKGFFYSITLPKGVWFTDAKILISLSERNTESYPLYLRFQADKVNKSERLRVSVPSAPEDGNYGDSFADTVIEPKKDSETEKGLLQSYLAAREMFFVQKQKNGLHHRLTVRAARLWFDTAFSLAKLPNRPYRMDQSAINIIQIYKSLPADKLRIRPYNSYIDPQVIESVIAQSSVLQFREKQRADELVNQGIESVDGIYRVQDPAKLERARLIYCALSAILKKSGTDIENNSQRYYDVDQSVLEDELAFIATLAGKKQSCPRS